MTRVMRDSTTAADIPLTGLDLVMGYGNGLYTWADTGWDRFGSIPHVHVDVNGSDPAGCGVLDVETGDATPAQAPAWAKQRLALGGYPPVIYCNRSTLTPLFNAMGAAGLQIGRHFRLGVATLDGTKALPDMTGVTFVQWKAATAGSGAGHYDESVVYDDAWHAPLAVVPATEYMVVRLPDGAAAKMLSGMVLK
jgi:hypothetical protein